MDLRSQDEQIRQWLEEDSEAECDLSDDGSVSETEDNVEEEIHNDTNGNSHSCGESSESEDEVRLSRKRQRTQIIDSNNSLGEESLEPRNSDSRDPRILQSASRFLFGKDKHK